MPALVFIKYVHIHPAAVVVIKGWDVADITIGIQFPDTAVIGGRAGYLAQRHYLAAEHLQGVPAAPLLPLVYQCHKQADVHCCDARIFDDSGQKPGADRVHSVSFGVRVCQLFLLAATFG